MCATDPSKGLKQYLVWVEDAESEETDDTITNLFEACDYERSRSRRGRKHKRSRSPSSKSRSPRKSRRGRKGSKVSTKKDKKKRCSSSSTSRTASDSSSSSSASSAAKKALWVTLSVHPSIYLTPDDMESYTPLIACPFCNLSHPNN